MQLLYEREQGGEADAYSQALCFALLAGKGEDDALMTGEPDEPDADDRAYIDRVLTDMPGELPRIDALIAKHSQGWTIERMPRVDLTILRLAALEMTRMSDIPDEVAIDEALGLAAQYSEPKSGRFINGVLGAIWRDIQTGATDES